jgi:cysteine-rich repeat protein
VVLVLATDCGDIMNSCVVYSDPGTAEHHNTTGADQVVYIVADGYYSDSYGPFTLDVQVTAVVCGDGFIVGAEACDDGDADDGDGCSSSCTVESGWHCGGEPSFCWTGGATCDDPFRLSAGSYVFSTEGYASDYDDYMGDCSTTGYGGAGPDMVFVVGVPAGLTLSVTMDGLPSWDEVVVIASDCPDITGSCLALADYSYEMPAQVTNTSGSEVVYFIVADGYFSSSLGEFSLDITVE